MSGNIRPLGENQSAWRSYVCSRKRASRGVDCQAPSISQTMLHEAVINRLMTDVFTDDNLRTLLPALKQAAADSTPVAARLHAAQHELSKVEKAIHKLLDTLETAESTPTMISRLAQREAEQAALKAEIAYLKAQISGLRAKLPLEEDDLGELRDLLCDQLLNGRVDLSRRILQRLIGRVTVNGKRAVVEYQFPL